MSETRRKKRDGLYAAACRAKHSGLKDHVAAWLEKNNIEHG